MLDALTEAAEAGFPQPASLVSLGADLLPLMSPAEAPVRKQINPLVRRTELRMAATFNMGFVQFMIAFLLLRQCDTSGSIA